MKRLMFTVLAALALGGGMWGCNAETGKSGGTTTTAKKTYACPMHLEVVSDRAGTCPKCDMALEEKK